MNHSSQVAPGPIYSGQKPERSLKYKAFVRKQASVVSGYGGCDACHTGEHSLGRKGDDFRCIPLTRTEHRAFDADPRGYALKHGLDIPAIIGTLNAAFEAREVKA